MKKLLPFLILPILCVQMAWSDAGSKSAADLAYASSATIVTLSPSAWTNIPRASTSTEFFNPKEVWIGQANGNANNCLIAVSTANLAPLTTTQGFVLTTTETRVMSLNRRLYLWGISTTINQNIVAQEFR